ncbi:MAG TPA: hypothetical protein DCM08_06165 [Microscillaceae bacterium]|nr:hypothetical protein [Microscillaceae bacterium]
MDKPNPTLFLAVIRADQILQQPAALQPYRCDKTPDLYGDPRLVVLPETSEEVAKILQLCQAHRFPIRIRGGGSGVAGGAVPSANEIVLSTERLHQIIAVSAENKTLHAQAGVITAEVMQAAQQVGLAFAQDIGSSQWSTIGGNVAVASGSPQSFYYQNTAHFVQNLRVALPNGDLFWTGNHVDKNASGYALTPLFCGSEGSLGIITEVVIRLVTPKPFQAVGVWKFRHWQEALESVRQLRLQTVASPTSIEWLDEPALTILRKFPETAQPPFLQDTETQAMVWVSWATDTAVYLPEIAHQWEQKHLLPPQNRLFYSDEQLPKAWALPMGMGKVLQQYGAFRDVDICVPFQHLGQIYEGIQAICQKIGIGFTGFGHVGNANLHVHLLQENLPSDAWQVRQKEAAESIYRLVIEKGGVISGEHGIGRLQVSYVKWQLSPEQLFWMQQLKKLFDPTGILPSILGSA